MIWIETGTMFDTRKEPARPDRVIHCVRIIVGGLPFVLEASSAEQARGVAVTVAKHLGLDPQQVRAS